MMPGAHDQTIEDLDAALAKAYGVNPRTPESEAKARRAREKRVVSPTDGRRARATGRTLQFNTKMTPDLKKRLVAASRVTGMSMAILTEQAFEALLAKLEGTRG